PVDPVAMEIQTLAAIASSGAPAPAAPSDIPEGWEPYSVVPGDRVWTVVRARVPEAPPVRVAEIVEAIDTMNRGRPQPSYGDVFVDVNKIHPGWTVLLPARVSPVLGDPIPAPPQRLTSP